MRWRGVTVLTNTPPRSSQRAPGGMQGVGIDGADPRQGGAASSASIRSRSARSTRRPARRRSVPRARAASRLRDERIRQGSARQGHASCSGGTSGRRAGRQAAGHQGPRHRRRGQPVRRRLDRLRRLVHHQAGRPAVSSSRASATSARIRCSTCTARRPRCSACRGRQCDVVFGNTAKNLPWTCVSAGSQTAHAMTRAAHAAATDAIKKLQEIAAKTHGGNPEAYKVAGGACPAPAAA